MFEAFSRRFWLLALILVAAVGGLMSAAPQDARAETTELILSSWLPPRHPIVVNAVKPWAKQIKQVTEGRVKVRILAKSLGAPPAHYDMAKDGVADITYGLHSFTKDDRFLRSRIGQFSFLGDDAVTASKAFWQVYGGTLQAQEEHDGVKLLGLFVHGPGIFHNNVRKIGAPGDFAGLKVRVPGGYIADLMAGLGANTQFMSSPEVYEKLSRGVIDGVTFTYEALTAFKLVPHIKYSMRTPGGIYNTTWFVVMNGAKWQSLSAADQAAIEAISGEAFAARVGKAWSDADSKAIKVLNKKGIEIYDAPADVLAALKASAGKLEANWAQAVAAEGFDGTAALAAMRQKTGIKY